MTKDEVELEVVEPELTDQQKLERSFQQTVVSWKEIDAKIDLILEKIHKRKKAV